MNICPKCGFDNKPGAKFCVKCGAKLTAAPKKTTENKAVKSVDIQNRRPANENASNALKDIFSYFWESVKHPANFEVPAEKYLGFVTLTVFSVLTWFITFVIGLKLNGQLPDEFRQAGSSTIMGLAGGIGLCFALINLAAWILGYVGIHFIMNNSMTLSEYTNDFGKFLNVGIIFQLVSVILIVILPLGSSLPIAFLLASYAILFSGWALVYEIFTADNFGGLDSFYVLLVIVLIISIVGAICAQVLAGNLVNSVSGMLNDLVKQKISDMSGY